MGSEVFRAKSGVLLGLLNEIRYVDPKTGVEVYDTSRIEDSRRLALLLKAAESFENRAFGRPTSKIEQTGQVDVVHQLAAMRDALLEVGDDDNVIEGVSGAE